VTRTSPPPQLPPCASIPPQASSLQPTSLSQPGETGRGTEKPERAQSRERERAAHPGPRADGAPAQFICRMSDHHHWCRSVSAQVSGHHWCRSVSAQVSGASQPRSGATPSPCSAALLHGSRIMLASGYATDVHSAHPPGWPLCSPPQGVLASMSCSGRSQVKLDRAHGALGHSLGQVAHADVLGPRSVLAAERAVPDLTAITQTHSAAMVRGH
jgi:hypothetical protein